MGRSSYTNEIILKARDLLSPALKNVAREADNAGRKAEDAGRRATRSTQDWGRAASALGTALGGLTVAAVRLSNDAEVSQVRLQQSIENTGATYEEYAAAIDKASESALRLAFDDEDAADSIAKLTDATGDATRAINDLALVQDIARARGIGLAEATNIVIAAEQGRFTSLKRMGIAVDETATKESVLAALQQKYAGQAEAYAETNAASWDRIGNTIENKLEAIGGALADFQGPILALSSASLAIGPLSQAFDALGGKAGLAAGATRALSLALSPAGLLGIVGTLTAGMVYLVATTDEFSASAQAAEDESADLANSYAALAASIDDVTERERTRQAFSEFSGLQEQAQKDLRTYEELQNAVDEWASEFPQLESVAVGALLSLTEAQQEWLDFNHDGRISMEELTSATEQFGQKALLTSEQASSIGDNLTQALSHADVDINLVLDGFNKLEDQWRAGEISGQEFADGVEAISRAWGDYTPYTLEAAEATNKVTTAWQDLRTVQQQGWAAIANSSLVSLGYENQKRREAAAIRDANEAELEGRIDAGVAGTIQARADAWENARDRQQEYVAGLGDEAGLNMSWFDPSAMLEAAREETAALDAQLSALADTLKADFAGAASAAYNRSVGFTNNIVKSIETTKDWTDAMTGALGTDFMDDGTWSKLAQMVQDGTLDQEDYNEALTAQEQIYGDLARAQEASAEIQIKQADALADGTKASADYLENIAAMDEAAQGLALAWADTDIAEQAMEVANLAGEFGNMNDSQQIAFENMVLSAAATNPALAAVLDDLGIIKKDLDDPTGWALDIDESDASASIQDVVDAIDRLAKVIALAYNLNVTSTLDDTGFWEAYNALPNSKAINVYTVSGDYGYTPFALGGQVPYDTAALGRMTRGNMTLVGEHGPELAMLPGGTTVIPNHASRYMDGGRGGGITFNGPITVVANDPQSFMRQLRTYNETMARR